MITKKYFILKQDSDLYKRTKQRNQQIQEKISYITENLKSVLSQYTRIDFFCTDKVALDTKSYDIVGLFSSDEENDFIIGSSFKKVHYGNTTTFYPKQNSKEGRLFHKALQDLSGRHSVDPYIGNQFHILDSGRIYGWKPEIYNDVVVLVYPFKDDDEDEYLPQHIELQVEKEIKKWEYEKIVDESHSCIMNKNI